MERSLWSCDLVKWTALLVAITLLPAAGCHRILATAMYVSGGGDVPAECEALKGKRVVVVCQLPVAYEFNFPGAARDISREVSRLLAVNVKDVDVVNQSSVDDWTDEEDGEDFLELASAVDADMVVHVELSRYDLRKGQTLYQGQADVDVAVYDMQTGGDLIWEKHHGEILYPNIGGVPVQEVRLDHFHRKYVQIVANQIARYFYPYDANADFAIGATANL